MQQRDDLLTLLQSVPPTAPTSDRRRAIHAIAGRRRRRRRLSAVTAMTVLVATGAMALTSVMSDGRNEVLVGPMATDAPEDSVVEVPGLADPIVVSSGPDPADGVRAFGSVAVGASYITGATHTSLRDDRPAAIVAVMPGPGVAAVEVTGELVAAPQRAVVQSGRVLLVVELTEQQPVVVLEVTTFDRNNGRLAGARISPFRQDPLSCETNTVQLGGDDEPGDPAYLPHLDAHLTAPLPAACR